MVLAARDLADELDRSCPTTLSPNATIAALDSFGYAQATEYVYGMPYDTWKQQYQRQATADEMKRYKESESIHVKHELSRLEQRDRNTASAVASNVCCEPTPLPRTRASVEEFYNYTGSFKFAVLTVSDRAFRGEYDTGDLSGPAVVETLQSLTSNIASIEVAIVPDEKQDIQSQLVKWCDNIDVILTTGGTGFSRRDVTPEATREILDVEWRAVMTLSRANVLSRGTAGFRKNTVIANLPGNPKAAREILPALLPVLWNATLELQQDVDESQVATTLNLENFPVVEP